MQQEKEKPEVACVPNADFAQFAAIRTLLGIVHAIAKCGVGQTNLFLDIGDHGG